MRTNERQSYKEKEYNVIHSTPFHSASSPLQLTGETQHTSTQQAISRERERWGSDICAACFGECSASSSARMHRLIDSCSSDSILRSLTHSLASVCAPLLFVCHCRVTVHTISPLVSTQQLIARSTQLSTRSLLMRRTTKFHSAEFTESSIPPVTRTALTLYKHDLSCDPTSFSQIRTHGESKYTLKPSKPNSAETPTRL